MLTTLLFEVVRPGNYDGDHAVFGLCSAVALLLVPFILVVLGYMAGCYGIVGQLLMFVGMVSVIDGLLFLLLEG